MTGPPLLPQHVPESMKAYLARRQAFGKAVLDFLRREHPRLVVRGSFSRGDFHLRRHGEETYSDVDLILPGVPEHNRFVLADAVSAGLRARGLPLPVSVQPMDAFAQLSERTSRYVHLG